MCATAIKPFFLKPRSYTNQTPSQRQPPILPGASVLSVSWTCSANVLLRHWFVVEFVMVYGECGGGKVRLRGVLRDC